MKKWAFVLLVAFALLVPLSVVYADPPLVGEEQTVATLAYYYASEVCEQHYLMEENCYEGNANPFPADTPFHVAAGWLMSVDAANVRPLISRVELNLNGEPLAPDFIGPREVVYLIDQQYLLVPFYWNFPEGLSTGEYELLFTYSLPCSALVEEWPGLYDCPTPNALTPVHRFRLAVAVAVP